MKNLEHLKEMISQVKTDMDKLINITDTAINSLPEEERKKVSPIQRDIHSVLDAVKKGDTSKINEISKKYAGSNNK
jgi:hypothetical protein